MTGRVAPGWYPDYDAPPGHQRYWNGERWTERRSPEPPQTQPAGGVAGWVSAVVVCLVAVSAAVLVLGDDHTASSGPGSLPPPASTPAAPASQDSRAGEEAGPQRRTWDVAAALDGTTIQLSNGATVRLVGVTAGADCSPAELGHLVEGRRVTLTRRGPDKDADGRLLRYVERDGVDVGLRLIQRGLAGASELAHPRRAIYRRVDDRSPDVC